MFELKDMSHLCLSDWVSVMF